MQNAYKEPITITYSNLIAKVYIPILETSEKEKRMQHIHKASTKILKGVKK